jgi:hypothetical protein
MIPHRTVPVPPTTHDPKAALTSAAKLVALIGTTCLFVGLLTAAVVAVLVMQLGAQH